MTNYIQIYKHFSEYSTKNKGMRPPRIVRPKNLETLYEQQLSKVECLECGKKLKHINWIHLKKHNMTPDKYRETFHLRYTDGLTSESTKLKRSVLVKQRIANGQSHFTSGDPRTIGNNIKKRKTHFKIRRSPHSEIQRINQSKLMKEKFKTDKTFRENALKMLKISNLKRRGICLVCQSADRVKIEKLINQGIADQKIEYLGVSRGTIQRHRRLHMGISVFGRRRISNYKETNCVVCGKHFGYYQYERTRYGVPNYDRKYCGNKCKGLGMRKRN